jgi:hypothetical protein
VTRERLTHMARWALGVAALAAFLALPCEAAAQSNQSREVDVDRLPVSILRIQRQLRHEAIREQRDGLKLRYYVEVYGQAPPLELFTKEDNLVTGPVPYGAPTHQEILNVITPQPFRTPVMDFRALIDWLAKRKEKK